MAITPDSNWKPLSPATPTWDILLVLGATVGLPYFTLASTAPLMQAWFSQHHPGVSPYRLYALSNTASLLALLSYPFVFEPIFSRSVQSTLWAIGFGVFVIASMIGVWATWKRGSIPSLAQDSTNLTQQELPHPTTGIRALWLALPACAVGLLLAVTNQITMDLVIVPFLWVLLLCLYLLTFILSFEGERWDSRPVFL